MVATVPPPVMAANRAQLMTLIATNILGQNTAAIAATEAAICRDVGPGCDGDGGLRRQHHGGRGRVDTVQEPPIGLAGPAGSDHPSVHIDRPRSCSRRSARRRRCSPRCQTSMSRLQMLSTPAEFAMEPMNMADGPTHDGGQSVAERCRRGYAGDGLRPWFPPPVRVWEHWARCNWVVPPVSAGHGPGGLHRGVVGSGKLGAVPRRRLPQLLRLPRCRAPEWAKLRQRAQNAVPALDEHRPGAGSDGVTSAVAAAREGAVSRAVLGLARRSSRCPTSSRTPT